MEWVIKWNREVIMGLTEMVIFDERPKERVLALLTKC